MRIFASLVHGIDLDRWGAFGFSIESVRDKLARELQDDDRILTIGTSSEPTPHALQRRLLTLMKVGKQQISTEAYVEPAFWREHLERSGGKPRWAYGLPIIEAETFDNPLPLKDDIIPRFREGNLHRKLAANYELLTQEEASRVLDLSRSPASSIYRAQTSTFQAHRLSASSNRRGPPPSLGTRILLARSGPAVTYMLRLNGTAANVVGAQPHGHFIIKVGFSNDLHRRQKEINHYLPFETRLFWSLHLQEWHKDEINAYAMEQELISRLKKRGFINLSGEMFVGSERDLMGAWTESITQTVRPTGDIEISE